LSLPQILVEHNSTPSGGHGSRRERKRFTAAAPLLFDPAGADRRFLSGTGGAGMGGSDYGVVSAGGGARRR
jgi:hypothetical protein